MTDEVDEMPAASRGSVANRTYWKTNGKRTDYEYELGGDKSEKRVAESQKQ